MLDPYALVANLADGRFHSGTQLAAQYGVSRMSICKAVKTLCASGLEVDAVRGQGYRLRASVELLDSKVIRQHLTASGRRQLAALDILPAVDSTNTWLSQQARQGAASGSVCLAESQSAGKGRRGRQWVSPFAANLYLSLLWRFERSGIEIGGLGPMIGIAVAEAIGALGVEGVAVKWPNDITWQKRKIAGVLLELAGELGGLCSVVIGVGINIDMPDTHGDAIDQPWVDLRQAMPGGTPSRNRLAALVVDRIIHACMQFSRQGLEDLPQRWRKYDGYHGMQVELHQEGVIQQGTSLGIDDMGRLIMEINGDKRVFASGDVSLRQAT